MISLKTTTTEGFPCGIWIVMNLIRRQKQYIINMFRMLVCTVRINQRPLSNKISGALITNINELFNFDNILIYIYTKRLQSEEKRFVGRSLFINAIQFIQAICLCGLHAPKKILIDLLSIENCLLFKSLNRSIICISTFVYRFINLGRNMIVNEIAVK